MEYTRRIVVGETNLLVKADSEEAIEEAEREVLRQRQEIKDYIERNPLFMLSFEPVEVEEDAPEIVRQMAHAGKLAGVGPFASVAGAIAEFAARAALRAGARHVVAENGGDIFLHSYREVVIGLYAGDSPLSNKLGFRIKPEDMPLGVCTSSGTVGHSISFGNADAVTVFASSAVIADAFATAIANLVKSEEDIQKAVEFGKKAPVMGGVVVYGETLGVFGKTPELVYVNF